MITNGRALAMKVAQRVGGIRAGKVEIRTVERRRLFTDGKPFGNTIPLENAAEP